ncbi:hypothetical protein ES705_27311 [subsurface metagenome]
MLYKTNTKRLIKKGIPLNKENVQQINAKIREFLQQKGHCVVAFIGSPGSRKSTLARFARQNGLLSIPEDKLLVIDDLCGPNNERYRRKDLRTLINALNNKVLLLFDFRAALYVKKADIGIIMLISEENRAQNLKRRSAGGYKKYECTIIL